MTMISVIGNWGAPEGAPSVDKFIRVHSRSFALSFKKP